MTRALAALAAALLLGACQKRAASDKPATVRDLYVARCGVCHMPDGGGMAPYYPPLNASPWVTGPPERLAAIILSGIQGPDGKYNGAMPAWGGVLSDADIAALVTYLREKEGKPPFTPIQVNQVRIETSARNSPWTVQDLANLHIH